MAQRITESETRRMALLIDGDNAQPSLIGKILTEASKFGTITIRRIYGDWTTSNMGGWKNTLNNHAIQPIQQFRYTIGKNATDSAMIIDAMDILHSHSVDGFCIVSSDSDYTRLATRIREMGIFVMGIGKKKTPKAFVNACNIFIYTENLEPQPQSREPRRPGGRREPKKTEVHEHTERAEREERDKDLDPVPLIKGAYEMAMEENGWANLASMGFYLRQLDPSFDPRTYGYKQLSQLIRAHANLFDLRVEEAGGKNAIWLKSKE